MSVFQNNLLAAAASAGGGGYAFYGFSSNTHGEMGLGNTTDYRDVPKDLDISDATFVDFGGYCMHYIIGGKLYSVGRNDKGQLGLGNTTDISTAAQVGSDTDWVRVRSTDNGTVMATKTGGELFTWGNNESGMLGQNTYGAGTDVCSPVQIGSLTDWGTNFAPLNGHCFSIKEDGTLWGWGRNTGGGAIGDGTSTTRSSPVQIGSRTDWDLVSGGSRSSLGIISGKLYSWGTGYAGMGGRGNTTDVCSPVQVGSDTDWAGFGCIDGLAVIGIKTTGKAYGFGRNNNGQLGLGTTTNMSNPTQIGSLTDWKVTSGAMSDNAYVFGNSDGDNSWIQKTDGTLWTMGESYSGGTTLSGAHSSPVQCATITTWTDFAQGRGNPGVKGGRIST